MIPKRVPREPPHKSMILVKVISKVRKDYVRRKFALELLKTFLYRSANMRQEAISKRLYHNLFGASAAQERLRALPRFFRAGFIGTKNHPIKIEILTAFDQPQ